MATLGSTDVETLRKEEIAQRRLFGQCLRKVAYPTSMEATAATLVILAREPYTQHMGLYQCDHCDEWHATRDAYYRPVSDRFLIVTNQDYDPSVNEHRHKLGQTRLRLRSPYRRLGQNPNHIPRPAPQFQSTVECTA